MGRATWGQREYGERNIPASCYKLPAQSRTDCGQALKVKEEKSFNSLNKAVSSFSLYWCMDTHTHTYLYNKNNIIHKNNVMEKSHGDCLSV